MAWLHTSDLQEVANAVQIWLFDGLTLREMKEKFPKFDFTEAALEIEGGNGVTVQWNYLLSDKTGFHPEFFDLIDAASKRPLLRQLFPVVSIGQFLSFSGTTGYPFSKAGGYIVWGGKARYRAVESDHNVIGEGSIEEVLDMLERTIPPNTGPAIFGTAEDL